MTTLDPLTIGINAYAPLADPYVANPVEWVGDKLDGYLWSKQRDIAESVVANRYTAVQSCHDAGKSFLAGRLATWWIDSHPHGEAFVVTTAPTAPQVSAILWKEIGRAHRKGQLAGHLTAGDVPRWMIGGEPVAYGRKPADHDQAAFQGIHAVYVLIILDEAGGVPKDLFDAVDALATNVHARVLAIGNPDNPVSQFATICKPGSGWNVIRIDGLQTPNMTAEALEQHPKLAALFAQLELEPSSEDIPTSLRPLLLSPMWVEERIVRWGIESPIFQAKVRGLFPDVSVDTLIPPGLITAAQQRESEAGAEKVMSVDVARFGTDRTVIALAEWPRFRILSSWAKQATTTTTGRVIATQRDVEADTIRVDGNGVGGGVVDQLAEQGYPVEDMQAGASPRDSVHFLNARAEWYWSLRERFEAGEVDIDPHDDELAAQLGSIRYKFTSKGQIQVESKDDMRKRGLPSPDRADSMMLASEVIQPARAHSPAQTRIPTGAAAMVVRR